MVSERTEGWVEVEMRNSVVRLRPVLPGCTNRHFSLFCPHTATFATDDQGPSRRGEKEKGQMRKRFLVPDVQLGVCRGILRLTECSVAMCVDYRLQANNRERKLCYACYVIPACQCPTSDKPRTHRPSRLSYRGFKRRSSAVFDFVA